MPDYTPIKASFHINVETVVCSDLFPANDNSAIGTLCNGIHQSNGQIVQLVSVVMPNGIRIYHAIWIRKD